MVWAAGGMAGEKICHIIWALADATTRAPCAENADNQNGKGEHQQHQYQHGGEIRQRDQLDIAQRDPVAQCRPSQKGGDSEGRGKKSDPDRNDGDDADPDHHFAGQQKHHGAGEQEKDRNGNLLGLGPHIADVASAELAAKPGQPDRHALPDRPAR